MFNLLLPVLIASTSTGLMSCEDYNWLMGDMKFPDVSDHLPRTYEFLLGMLNASVCQFRDLLVTAFAVLGVVRYTSVSDLCHCVTPKVVGF